MAADGTPAQAQAAANTKYYLKSAFFSMISLTLAHQFAGYLTDREENVACELHVNDNSWFGAQRYDSLRFFNPKDTHHDTQYVAMRDGVDLAVDTYMAQYLHDKQQKVPTVIFPTRHGRGYTLDFPFSLFARYDHKFTNPRANAYIQRFVTNGYAWVSVDVRGTGASAGTKQFDFSDAEVQDAYDVIEWITQQPWSNGKVAAFGQGLDGTGALLMAASEHPALKAVSVNGAPADVFQGALFPGGVKNDKALDDYASFTSATDRQQRWDRIPTFKPRAMLKYFGGEVYRVDDDDAKFDNYIYQHEKNPNLAAELQHVRFRDDPLATAGATFDAMDARRHLGKIADSGAALQLAAGYFDMGVARSSIQLFQYVTNTLDADTAALLPPLSPQALANVDQDASFHRLTLGPWSHAGVDNADPFAQSKHKCFYHLDEVSRFLDHHLYPNRRPITKMADEQAVHYFTMAHNRWKESATWPPAYVGEQSFYLGAEQTFQDETVRDAGQLTLNVSTKPKHDVVSRWDVMDHLFGLRPFYYHDREGLAEQFATFLTPELPLTEVTGEAELRLFFSVDKPDVSLVAYLEDVDYTPPFPNENKRPGVTYVTEALLNPVHQTVRPNGHVHSFKRADAREIVPGQVYEAVLRFEPMSYVVKREHQLRVSVGVAGPPDFGSAGPNEATTLTVHFGGDHQTKLTLPSYTGLYDANVVPQPEALDDLESIPTAEAEPEVAQEDEVDEFADTKDEL